MTFQKNLVMVVCWIATVLSLSAGTLPKTLKPEPHQRDPYNWMDRHNSIIERHRKLKPDYVFFGDSITHWWGGEPGAPGRAIGSDSWTELFRGNTVTNLGFGFDYIDNAYYRVENGELDNISPRFVLVNLGTNNLGHRRDSAAVCGDNMSAFIELIRKKLPKSKILLIGIYPRKEPNLVEPIVETNKIYATLADRRQVFFVNPGARLLGEDGRTAEPKFMRDAVHLNADGYRIIAAELEKELSRIDKVYAKKRKNVTKF